MWDKLKEVVGLKTKNDIINLKDFFSFAPGNFFCKNSEGVYLSCNESTLKTLNLKLTDFVGKTDEALWPEQVEKIRLFDETLLRWETLPPLEIVYQSKHFLMTMAPFIKGTETFLIGNFCEITQQRKNEIELKQKTDVQIANLERIIEATPCAMYWKDRSGTYLGCNDSMLKISHVRSKAELVGKKDADLWPTCAESLQKNDEFILKTGRISELEETINGDVYFSIKAPLRDKKNNIIGIIGNSMNVTQLKENEAKLVQMIEELESDNKTKTEFLENISHDIRTPVTGIIGCAELIKNVNGNTTKVEEYSNILIKSSKALLNFLNSMLDSVRISSNEVPILKKKFNIKSILEEIVELNQSKAHEKQLSLRLKYDPLIPRYMIGDPKRTYRIVLELVTNALKYTEEGHVIVSATLAKNTHGNIVVKLLIKDSGIGISTDDQQDIFLRFKRLNPSFQGVYHGSGLGLSIVKQFLDDIDGEIYVSSVINQGTTFTCILPFKESLLTEDFGVEMDASYELFEPPETQSSASKEEEVEVRSYNGYILLVEDHDITAKITKDIFSNLNYRVDVAKNGETALSMVQKNDYNIIFLDIGLPDIDGCKVTQLIREGESGKYLPIVGLTAHVSSENKQQCIAAGMNVVYTKPLVKEKIEEIFEMFIPKYHKQKKPAADFIAKLNNTSINYAKFEVNQS